MKKCRVFWLGLLFFLAVASVKGSTISTKAAVTITKTDTTTAKKVHNAIIKGKAATLKVKGSKKSATAKVKSIASKIRKVNGQGVTFHYKTQKKSGKYYLYSVSKENAKLYMYSVKFINKLYTKYKDKIAKTTAGVDYKRYPDQTTRRLRIIYDTLVKNVQNGYRGYDGYTIKFFGTNAATTKTTIWIKDLSERWSYYESLVVKSKKAIEERIEDATDLYGNPVYREVGEEFYFYTFNEFAARTKSRLATIMKKVDMTELSSQQQLALKKKFCDLSSAMKVYVIADSKYFAGAFKRSDYNMIYTYQTYWGKSGSAGMKILYDNKAKGVCQVFASYEKLLFDQIGVTSYICASMQINHAWSVVKVKNSAGKTLWIPFDYGIGPATGLMVNESQKKYINTEAKRYKLYLGGLKSKGAPTKKNFVTSDFK